MACAALCAIAYVLHGDACTCLTSIESLRPLQQSTCASERRVYVSIDSQTPSRTLSPTYPFAVPLGVWHSLADVDVANTIDLLGSLRRRSHIRATHRSSGLPVYGMRDEDGVLYGSLNRYAWHTLADVQVYVEPA